MALLGDFRPYQRRASSPASITPYSPPHPQIEILLSLPDARIVEFKPPGLDSRPIKKNENALIDVEPGSLPWASRFERTIAVGSLQIYRAPESIAFLNCQNAIRPILPRSQAWCVDGGSKFVLGSPPLFWRIELPKTSHDEEIRVEGLKRILDEILRYEKSPCPFQRTFKVELRPQTPILNRKGSQKYINHSRESNDSDNNSLKDLQNYTFHSKSLRSNGKISNPTHSSEIIQTSLDLSGNLSLSGLSPESPRSANLTHQSAEEKLSLHKITEQTRSSELEKTQDPTEGENISISCSNKSHLEKENPEKSVQLLTKQQNEKQHSLSASYDARLPFTPNTIKSSSASTTTKFCEVSLTYLQGNLSQSQTSNSATLNSIESSHSSLDRSSNLCGDSFLSSISNYSNEFNIYHSTAPSGNSIGSSENTVATKTVELGNRFSSGLRKDDNGLSSISKDSTSSDETEKLVTSGFEIPEMMSPDSLTYSQNRKMLDNSHFSRNNSLAPALSYKMLHLAHQVPTQIVRKTSDIFLNPSNNLFQLMLGIASRIASGEWRGVLSNFAEPIHWDFEDDFSNSEWLDSDFRNSNRVRMADLKVSGSWEFD